MNEYHVASDVVLTVGGSTTSHAVRNSVPTVVVEPPADSIEQRNAAYLASTTSLVTVTTGGESAAELCELLRLAARTDHGPCDLRWGGAADLENALCAV